MEPKIWAVVRFPSGAWSGSGVGNVNAPEYAGCEVYLAKGDIFDKAKKRAQSVRAGLVRKGAKYLPTQQTPFFCDWEAAIPDNFEFDRVSEPVTMAMEDPVGTERVFAKMAAEARGLGVDLVYLDPNNKV